MGNQTLLEGLWMNHLICRLEFTWSIEFKLSTVGSQVLQQKSICPIVNRLNPDDATVIRGQWSKIGCDLWVKGMANSLRHVNHKDTNQSWASVCLFMHKRADNAFHSMCYSAL